MKKNLAIFSISIFVFACTIAPVVTHAFNLIPCGNQETGGIVTDANQCDLNSFIALVRNVINALFIISIPLASVSFVAIGIMLLFAQGNPGKIQRAKKMAWSILIGFIIILSAWLIVYTITHALLNSDFPTYLKT